MKRSLFLVFAMLLGTVCVFAQDAPKAEIFGGYSYLRLNADGTGINANGWNAALTGNMTKHVGITADFSGHYTSAFGTDGHAYSFLFGPQFSGTSNNIRPFVHTLFGVTRIGAGDGSDNAFAMALGGGVDVNVHKNFAIRLGQADYLMTRFGDATQNNFRFSTGVVLKF